MNMVGHTTNCKWNRAFVTDNATDILEHTLQIFITHDDTCAFRMKNNVGV